MGFLQKLEALIGVGGCGGSKSSEKAPMKWHFRKLSASESDPEHSAESIPPKRLKIDESRGNGVGKVAKAILGFTEAYEKAETAKFKLMSDLEKERMKFSKEMGLQRMQFLKTQMEIRLKNEEEERSKGGDRRRVIEDDDGDRNVKNNGDVSR